jgi:hypothetical protein
MAMEKSCLPLARMRHVPRHYFSIVPGHQFSRMRSFNENKR